MNSDQLVRMEQVTVMFELDARLLSILKQNAEGRGLSVADVIRNAVSKELLVQPQIVQKVSAAE